MTHDAAIRQIRGWGFTKHPHCHDRAGNPAHYPDWVVDDHSPAGSYDCGYELDLTFVAPGPPPPSGATPQHPR
jgi:hypothetical protein